MATDTWTNLDPERRLRIERAAAAEFASCGFTAASLNVIASEAKIAKGSLFQYFENKLDLWATITGDAVLETLAEIAQGVPAEPRGFPRLTAYALEWVRYLRREPITRQLAAATIDEIDAEARNAMRDVTNRLYRETIAAMVREVCLEEGISDADDIDDLATQFVLLLRFLASAPFVPDRDPILGLCTRPWDEIERCTQRLVLALQRAYSSGR